MVNAPIDGAEFSAGMRANFEMTVFGFKRLPHRGDADRHLIRSPGQPWRSGVDGGLPTPTPGSSMPHHCIAGGCAKGVNPRPHLEIGAHPGEISGAIGRVAFTHIDPRFIIPLPQPLRTSMPTWSSWLRSECEPPEKKKPPDKPFGANSPDKPATELRRRPCPGAAQMRQRECLRCDPGP